MSALRIAAGLVCLGILVLAMLPLLVLLLPWRSARIRVTNVFGTWIGKSVMWCAGCPVTVHGRENVDSGRPAIYAANHTSIFDAFTTIWLTPLGTVGTAKKEVFFTPFYGQAWWLAGHLFLDRGNTDRAKASLMKTAKLVRDKKLHICLLPEGTRSPTGRLLPFKKGIVHLALATKLPIVPMVITGAANTWKKGSWNINPSPIEVRFLPPISTEHWSEERIEEQLAELRRPFLEWLEEEPRTEALPPAA